MIDNDEPRVVPLPDGGGPSRAVVVALVAAVVPTVWMQLVMGGAPLPVHIVTVLASMGLWFQIARLLAAMPAAGPRLAVAIGYGLLSPLLGVGLVALGTTCSPCCMFSFALPGMFGLMVDHPLWFFPVGLGMGFVAFAVVSVRRAPAA